MVGGVAVDRNISDSDKHELKEYTDNAVRGAKQDLKVWLMGSILASAMTVAVPGIGMVFYLGNISNKLDAAFQVQEEQEAIIKARGEWMQRRNRSEEGLITWAKTKGYIPPEPIE